MSKRIYVVTAPSGTGKTTIDRRLVEEVKHLEISTSYTTRQRRPQETHGDHYYFVSNQEFDDLENRERMLETASVFGNRYGTCMDELEKIWERNHDVLLEIDVQGWLQIKDRVARQTEQNSYNISASSIMILPPSIRELWRRLTSRGTESEESQLRRIKAVRFELSNAVHYNHFVVNDDLETAYQQVKSIVLGQQEILLNYNEGNKHCSSLIQELDSGDWQRKA